MTRKRGKRARDQPNLRRFRATVHEYVDERGTDEKPAVAGKPISADSDDESYEKTEVTHPTRNQNGIVAGGAEGVEKFVGRKQRRKDARLLKKARRLAFSQHRTVPKTIEEVRGESIPGKDAAGGNADTKTNKAGMTAAEKTKKKLKAKANKKKKAAAAVNAKKETELGRKAQLYAQNKADDRLIKKLSKDLKMTKRKRKNLPAAFAADNLDYILDAVDKDKLMNLQDSDIESIDSDEAPHALPVTKRRKRSVAAQPASSDDEGSDNSGAKESVSDEEEFPDESEDESDDTKRDTEEEEEEEEEEEDDEEEDLSAMSKKDKKWILEKKAKAKAKDHGRLSEKLDEKGEEGSNEAELREDIYGRLRDASGNVVPRTAASDAAYIPPAKRAAMLVSSVKKKFDLERLTKQIKGLLNRLSENNMQPVSAEIEVLYRSHSRAEMNECMVAVIRVTLLCESAIPDRLLMVLAMLVAVLHGNVGLEVGAYILQEVVSDLDRLLVAMATAPTQKSVDNILTFLSHLYNFRVVHCLLLFDILKRLSDTFQEKHIELLLLVLKTVGFSLRKDDPMALKELILAIQVKAGAAELDDVSDRSRIKFMLDVLLAIRNNNVRKISGYDPEAADHCRQLIRSYVRDSSDRQLRISLSDLLDSETRGRWWIVGSAWAGGPGDQNRSAGGDEAEARGVAKEAVNATAEMLALARKQRMNTDVRRDVFCIMMNSEDYCDAFEKLLKLRLTHHQEREIVHVLVDCCQQEQKYNPFYAFLAQKLIVVDRRFMMTLQFTFWDKFKTLGELSLSARANLSQLLVHLITHSALTLAVFKVLPLAELDKPSMKFVRSVLLAILVNESDTSTGECFQRVSQQAKYEQLRDGLALFLQHFIRNPAAKFDVTCSREELLRKVSLAESALLNADIYKRM